tara:strand:- start:479 stop:706 length:228 start_codon:yes stop_codon:yes gene_type:complete
MDHLRKPVPYISARADRQWRWREIAEYISIIEGEKLSKQRCQQVAHAALLKLRKKLKEEPLLQDWLHDNGYGTDL